MAAVLVTGAAGFAGSHLLDLLRSEGADLVAWHRPGTPTLEGTESWCRWMAVELLDSHAVSEAVADVRPSAVYHLAGAAHVAQSWKNTHETFAGNVLASQHLFAGLRRARLTSRVLVTCSAHIYAPADGELTEESPIKPTNPYATSKLAQETLSVRAWTIDGIPTLIARAFNHIGPRQAPTFVAASIARQIALIEAGRLPSVLTMGNLEPRRDLTDVRDTVRAYRAMMESARPGVPYNVCSGRALAIRTLIDTFLEHARVDVKIVQDQALFRPNEIMHLVGSHERLTAETGWTPTIPLDQTVEDLLAYWRSQAT
jgi:GDP-4-dehydro-6-deoxy-D-mannose reductase